ncbi:hypothetical protein SE92_10985 [Bradyrhizobium sp. AT1]|nr:hypothetical protein SE92_10985 [Bradyrhizobium sp. AT1]
MPLRLVQRTKRLQHLPEVHAIAGVLRGKRDGSFETLTCSSGLSAQQRGDPQHIHAAMMAGIRLQDRVACGLGFFKPTRTQGVDRLIEACSARANVLS